MSTIANPYLYIMTGGQQQAAPDGTQIMVPAWAAQQPQNLYQFRSQNDLAQMQLRLRRVEAGVPYRKRGKVVRSSTSSRAVQASAVSTTGTINTTSVQTDSTVSGRRSYDTRTTTRENQVL